MKNYEHSSQSLYTKRIQAYKARALGSDIAQREIAHIARSSSARDFLPGDREMSCSGGKGKRP